MRPSRPVNRRRAPSIRLLLSTANSMPPLWPPTGRTASRAHVNFRLTPQGEAAPRAPPRLRSCRSLFVVIAIAHGQAVHRFGARLVVPALVACFAMAVVPLALAGPNFVPAAAHARPE